MAPLHTLTCSGATATTLASLRWDLRTWAAVRTQDSDSRAPEPNHRSSGTRDRSSTLSRTCQGKRPGPALRPPTILFTRGGRGRDGRPQAGGHTAAEHLADQSGLVLSCSRTHTWQTTGQSGSQFWAHPVSTRSTAVGTCSTETLCWDWFWSWSTSTGSKPGLTVPAVPPADVENAGAQQGAVVMATKQQLSRGDQGGAPTIHHCTGNRK